MPNWKNKEDYAFTDHLSAEAWAWEFLRRNPIYQQDYKHVVELTALDTAKFGPPPKRGVLHKEDLPHTRFYEPERLPSETRPKWIKRSILLLDKEPKEYSPSQWYAKTWGLAGFMADPADDQPPQFLPYRNVPEIIHWEALDDYFQGADDNYELKPGVIALGFDLNLPLTPQLDAAQALLKEKAVACGAGPKTGQGETVQKGKLTQYLRVLDARVAEASNTEIASVLLAHEPNDTDTGYHATKKTSDLEKGARRVLENPRLCLRLKN